MVWKPPGAGHSPGAPRCQAALVCWGEGGDTAGWGAGRAQVTPPERVVASSRTELVLPARAVLRRAPGSSPAPRRAPEAGGEESQWEVSTYVYLLMIRTYTCINCPESLGNCRGESKRKKKSRRLLVQPPSTCCPARAMWNVSLEGDGHPPARSHQVQGGSAPGDTRHRGGRASYAGDGCRGVLPSGLPAGWELPQGR